LACGSRTIGSLPADSAAGAAGAGLAQGQSGSAQVLQTAGNSDAGSTLAQAGASDAGSNSAAGNASGGSVGGSASGVGGTSGAAGGGGFAGTSGAPSAAAHALMLVDSRLYEQLADQLERYRQLAEQRRGFSIELRAVKGLDDLGFGELKTELRSERVANPSLEGVLFIGNVALPTFYKPRFDNLSTRLYPYFYEDLDATFVRAQDPGTLDPRCVDWGNAPQQNCNVLGDTIVPPHDYDRFQPGAHLGPELWTAYLPVGVSGSLNDYPDFAAQLRPFLDKLLAFYTLSLKGNGRYYFVSNDPGWAQLELLWNALPRSQFDFYGKPGPQGQVGADCISGGQDLCYVRWPLESYDSYAAFKQAYQALPFLGEGWQMPSIFSAHMNGALYDMVEVNAPSDYGSSITTTQETAQLAQTGLIVALSGSSVTGFAPPRADTSVDIKQVLAGDSVGVAYLYDKARALAVLGDPTMRGHYANFPIVYATLARGGPSGYLGAAHLAQMQQNYADAGYEQCLASEGTNCGYTLSENASEMLLGDPFLDLK
jgi:hypothetical protein